MMSFRDCLFVAQPSGGWEPCGVDAFPPPPATCPNRGGVKSLVWLYPLNRGGLRLAFTPRGVDLAVAAPLSPPHSHVVPHLTNEV